MVTKFKQIIAADGKPVRGLYTSDICRVERNQDGLWVTEVPMRPLGKSGFLEFRPLELGGAWARIGSFKTRAGAMAAAEKMQDGEYVYDSAVARNGVEPIRFVRFVAVVDEIKQFQ